jgi:hypothetical protein
MDLTDTSLGVIALLSLIIAVRLCLPNLLVVIGYSRLQCGFRGGPREVECYWLNDVDESLYQEMTALGFEPLGVYWEQMPFTRVYDEYVFVRRGDNCYGLLFPNHQIMARRGHFLTVFEDGAVVHTKNHAGGVEMDDPTFVAGAPESIRTLPKPEPAPEEPTTDRPRSADNWLKYVLIPTLMLGLWATRFIEDSSSQTAVIFGLALAFAIVSYRVHGRHEMERLHPAEADKSIRLPLAEALTCHRNRVAGFLADGHRLPSAFDTDDFLEAQHRYHDHPRLWRLFQVCMLGILIGKLFMLTALPIGLGWYFGVIHWAPWTALLGTGLVGLWLRYGVTSARRLQMLGRITPQE